MSLSGLRMALVVDRADFIVIAATFLPGSDRKEVHVARLGLGDCFRVFVLSISQWPLDSRNDVLHKQSCGRLHDCFNCILLVQTFLFYFGILVALGMRQAAAIRP